MTHRYRPMAAVASLFAASVLLTACQSASTPTAAPAGAAAESTAPSPAASAHTAGAAGTAPATSASHASSAGSPACAPTALTAGNAHRLEPSPDHTYGVLVNLANTGKTACVVEGFPTVAIAGQGDPTHNRPLKVTTDGAAHPVRLSPGDRAYLMLTFHEVLGGDTDGHCASGATPETPPTLVIGTGGGHFQVAQGDGGGNFAECDGVVRTTAFLPTQP